MDGFVELGSYPPRAGNRLRPLIDGEPAFRRICEAVEAARRSVWVTVTFLWEAFEMPDGCGSFFAVLDRAAERGVDVRVIFWRPDDSLASYRTNTFWVERPLRFLARWDSPVGACAHQKSWLVDAGHDAAVGFVGGINLNPHSVVAPGHRGAGQNHDVYLELAGPCTTDMHHNFAQRWGAGMPLPHTAPRARGPSTVQIQRTCPGGERSIYDWYRRAIGAARRSIYIENDTLAVPEIVDDLHAALDRGVEVAVVTSGTPQGRLPTVGLAGLDERGARQRVHVHSKLMLVDDEWATVGSCNLHRHGLFLNWEMNASFRDPDVVADLRRDLLAEHLGRRLDDLDDVAALRRLVETAVENGDRWDRGEHDWPGLAYCRPHDT